MFGEPSILDYYLAIEREINNRLLNEQPNVILSTPTAQLVESYLGKFKIDKIEPEMEKQKIEYEKYIKIIPASQREDFDRSGGDIDFECERVVGTIPIKNNPNIHNLARFSTSTFSLSWSPKNLTLSLDKIIFGVEIKGYGFDYTKDENQILNMVRQEKKFVTDWIQYVNHDIDVGTKGLAQRLSALIEERKKKVKSDDDRINSINKKLNQI